MANTRRGARLRGSAGEPGGRTGRRWMARVLGHQERARRPAHAALGPRVSGLALHQPM